MRTHKLIIFLLSLVFLSCNKEIRNIQNSQGKEKKVQEIDAFFLGLMDSLRIPGMSVAIINRAEIVYHNTFGVTIANTDMKVSDKTLFEAASLSKPLVAYFAMKQVEKGLLDLDKPLYEYLPYPDIAYDERYKSITARMILSHSSGFPNWREDSLTIHFTPGSSYMYSGEGYKYLAHVLASINQVEFSDLDRVFQVDVVKQIDADKLYFKWNEDITRNKASGHINDQPTSNKKDHKDNDFGAAGGLHTEAVNYAKFLISLFKDQVIPATLKEEMLSEQIALPEGDINKLILGASGWSLGFGMIPTEQGTCYWHAGNNDDFQSWMHVYPEKEYGIVLFTNSDKVQQPDFFHMFLGFLDDGIRFDLSKLE